MVSRAVAHLLGEHLPQHDAEGVDVHLLVVGPVRVQLGRHVRGGARALLPLADGRQAEVAQLHLIYR
eukprot:1404629-Pyramimonas_sp.AAC.1